MVAEASGVWALFRLAVGAVTSEDGHVEWTDPHAGPIKLTFVFAGGATLLQSG
jgi:hypothetical protein